jgi:hypothetical protein
MHSWRDALQSKTMRNVVIILFAGNALGTYTAYVRLNRPVPEVDLPQEVASTVGDPDFDLGLPSRLAHPAQPLALASRSAAKAERLALAPTSAGKILPTASLAKTEIPNTFAESMPAVQADEPIPVRVASVHREAKSMHESAEFAAAFRSSEVSKWLAADSTPAQADVLDSAAVDRSTLGDMAVVGQPVTAEPAAVPLPDTAVQPPLQATPADAASGSIGGLPVAPQPTSVGPGSPAELPATDAGM